MITREQVVEAVQGGNFDTPEGLDAVADALKRLIFSEPSAAMRAQFLEAVEIYRLILRGELLYTLNS